MKKKIEVKLSNERLITPSGLSIVGAMLGKSDFVERSNAILTDKRSQPPIKNGDILLTYIGLLCQGKTEFDAVNEMLEGDRECYNAEKLRYYAECIVERICSSRHRCDAI